MDSEQPSKIEKLQKKLYSPNVTVDDLNNRKPLRSKQYDLEKSWADENAVVDSEHKYHNFFKTFLAISIIFFVLASGYAAYRFTTNKTTYSDDHIAMDVSGPISIAGGEALKLDVHIVNNNPTPLRVVDMVVKYPDGTKTVENVSDDLTVTREGLGTISSGEIVQRTLNAVFFGEENAKKQVEIILEYKVPNSDAVFEKKKTYDVVLSGSPIRVTVESLKEIQANQIAQLEVTVTSNSNKTIKDVLVRAEYPFGFTYKESDPKPANDTNVWNLGELQPQQVKKILVKGSIEGQNEEERVIKFTTGIKDQNDEKQVGVVLSKADYTILIKRPFFAVNLAIGGDASSDVVIKSGDLIMAGLNWKNNLPTILNDVQIEAKFTGPSLRRSSVNAERGFYRSLDNTLFWSSETYPKFSMLDAGDTGNVGFNFSTYKNAGEGQLFKNPELGLVITVKGNRITDNNVPEEIKSTITKRIKVMTDIFVAAGSYFSEGPFQNTGPFPPKQEQLTTYTVQLGVSNTANAVRNARIVAKVPSYVEWKNVFAPANEKVTYDQVSREFIWNIGDIAPGVGFASDKRVLNTQVGFFPSLSQVGTTPYLLTEIYFEGVDTFTGRAIRQEIPVITINISDKDKTSGDNRVGE